MSQVILQTSLLDGYLIPYTSYGRFNLRFGRSIHVSKCVLGVWFFKADFLSFCRCSFLTLQLTLPSKGYWEQVKWNSLQHKERHNTVGTQNCGVGGESETFLQVCFQGWEESGQLCSLDEGCSIRHCRRFLCFILAWAMCGRGPDLWGGNPSLQGLGDPEADNVKGCPGITGTWARKAVNAPFCSWREIFAVWCPPPPSAF